MEKAKFLLERNNDDQVIITFNLKITITADLDLANTAHLKPIKDFSKNLPSQRVPVSSLKLWNKTETQCLILKVLCLNTETYLRYLLISVIAFLE